MNLNWFPPADLSGGTLFRYPNGLNTWIKKGDEERLFLVNESWNSQSRSRGDIDPIIKCHINYKRCDSVADSLFKEKLRRFKKLRMEPK